MSTEIQNFEGEPYCLVMKNGIKIWLDNEGGKQLMEILSKIKVHQSLTFQEFEFNTAEHVGVFPQFVMSDLTKEKDGWTRCAKLKWHNKDNPCHCFMPKFDPTKQ